MKFIFSQFLTSLFPSKTAFAHCDVPCGIYDPKPAQIAAATVFKMVTLIDDIPQGSTSVEDRNKFVRCVLTKEEHARKCKEEILILWTDYFKPEHVENFPNLHDVIWKTTKLCSQNKQHVSKEMAQQLVDAVNEVADIFNQTKAAK